MIHSERYTMYSAPRRSARLAEKASKNSKLEMVRQIKRDCSTIMEIQHRFGKEDELQLGIELFRFLSTNPLSLRLPIIRKVITRQISYFEDNYKINDWDTLVCPNPNMDSISSLHYYMIEVQLHLLEQE